MKMINALQHQASNFENENPSDKIANEAIKLESDSKENMFKKFKKNALHKYDIMISNYLEWPSLTIQWLPRNEDLSKKNYSQKLLIGTQSSEQINYLLVGNVTLPNFDYISILERSQPQSIELLPINLNLKNESKFKIVCKIVHDGEVIKARYMSKDKPNIIATTSSNCRQYIYDYFKHPNQPETNQNKPELILKCHSKEGTGLSWNKFEEGYLLSSSCDGLICLWNVEAHKSQKDINPQTVYKRNEGTGVNDVCWHPKHVNLFGCCNDNSFFQIYDKRENPLKPLIEIKGHEDEINCIDFNPFNEWIIATGSTDTTLKIWDLRKLFDKASSITLKYHIQKINCIQWSPHAESIICSGSDDNTIIMWDISRLGESKEENKFPEIIFVHGGHQSVIYDLSWNPNEDLIMSSVDSNNEIQIWKICEKYYYDN